MKNIGFIALACLVWAFSLLSGTSLGGTYHTTKIYQGVLLAYAIGKVLLRRRLAGPRDLVEPFACMAVIFLGSSLLHGYGLVGAKYLTCFLLIYVFSKVPVRETTIRKVGFIYAGLGAAILLIYNFGVKLSGWNSNSIAMVGLFSYLVLIISFYNIERLKYRIWLMLFTLVYMWMIDPTGSRSCQLVMFLMCAMVVYPKSQPRLLQRRGWIYAVLLTPLAIAVFVVVLTAVADVEALNTWSSSEFGKTFFNGREKIWMHGFQLWSEAPLFGNGELLSGYWHNSAIGCLYSYGLIGFCSWIICFANIIKRGQNYLDDYIVRGSLTAFLLIYIQQSMEVGLFGFQYVPLIYVPLGLMMGRIKCLKERRTYADTES